MASRIDDLLDRVARLEQEIEAEIPRARARWRYRVHNGRVHFERGARLAHRRLKQSIPRFLRESSPSSLLTAPVVYSLIFPIALLDLWLGVYQAICFRAYRIARVRRADYIVIDRHHLAYLNAFEKLNCVYCGYANGVFAYAREVAARTEHYWCPIKHAKRVRAAHAHYREFLDYGDAEGYRHRLSLWRKRPKLEGRVWSEEAAMKTGLVKDSLRWGMTLWLIGYVLGIVLFFVMPVTLIGWVITPIGFAITVWVVLTQVRSARLAHYVAVAVAWTVMAIVFDYLFIVRLFNPPDGYYKTDVYAYYALTFAIPLIAGWWKTSTR